MNPPIPSAPTLQECACGISAACSADWSSKVEVDAVTAEGSSYHAELCRRGTVVCRISLSATFSTEDAAMRALDLRLRSWMADYETRNHTGRTAPVG